MEKTMPAREGRLNDTPLLTVAQAAEYAQLSKPTIYKYCRDDADPQIPHKRGPDGLIRIAREDLDHWFDQFKNRPRKKRNTIPS
jgi:excisionase family DNA binding protein